VTGATHPGLAPEQPARQADPPPAPPDGERQGDGASAGTVLALYPLTYLEEGDEVTVGCVEADSYAVLPADGAALLRQLSAGSSLGQAAGWYHETYGEQIDVAEFAETLAELGFVRTDGSGSEGARVDPAAPIRWQRLGRAVFSPPAAVCMAGLIAVWIIVMIRTPALVPSNHDIFFTRYISIIEVVVFLGQFPLLLIHESFHALAGRRLGLHSTLSIGRRLYYIVFLTAMDGLVTVPRRKRYLPMLAGLLADALVAAILTLVAGALSGPNGQLGVAGGICLALAYTTELRMLWQAYFYLETDLYYVVVTVFGCVQLQATARAVLRNRWNRLLGRADRLIDPESWHPRDRAVARWYSWFVLAGYTFSLVSLPVITVPVAYRVFTSVGSRLVHPSSQSGAGLTDSIVFLTLNAAQVLVIAWVVRRERATARAVRTAATIRPEETHA
jgi:hypothetical protein